MTVITLMTDFGAGDYGAGLLHGVIRRIAPAARVVDLSHEIPPQDIRYAQVLLENALPYFPEGSIHLVVVDPGVGTRRRPIAARVGPQYFVGPDNGLITTQLERGEARGWPIEIVHTRQPEYWLPQVSAIFHGRDIFAPLAAHLARGVPLAALGEPISDPVRLRIPAPERVGAGWRGQVIQVDHFGNLNLNIRRADLAGLGPVQVQINGAAIPHLTRTFGDASPGELIALIDSSDRLSVCVVNGNAAARLHARPGDPVEVLPGRVP